MYETMWLALFGAGVLTMLIAAWGPDPAATVFASLMNIALWALVANGAGNFVVRDGGVEAVYSSGAVSLVATVFAVSSIVPLLVGLYEAYEAWQREERPSTDGLSQEQIERLEDWGVI